MLNIIFFILCAFIIYHHLIYPIILKSHTSKPSKSGHSFSKVLPTITLIVPAFNEEKFIADKILNLNILSYPKHNLEIIVALDGCTDRTLELARKTLNTIKSKHIKLINFQENRGKIALLNELILNSNSEIIALSDVSALLPTDCLQILAKNFSDDCVGTVGGTYHFEKNGQSTAEQAYWKYQRAIKTGEASFGAPLGMHGAFYAFRKEYFITLPLDTINDDFILPMSIVAQGYKAIYDTEILTIEKEPSCSEMNWNRRIRISAGNVQQSIRLAKLLAPKFGGVAFSFFSGKFLRAWMPLMLGATFVLSAILFPTSIFHQFFFGFEILGLSIAFLPFSNKTKIGKIISILRYLLTGYVAGLIGTMRYFIGLEKGKWSRAHS